MKKAKDTIAFEVITQCAHFPKPCEPPPVSTPLTAWRSTRTIAIVPPDVWTVEGIETFVSALGTQSGIKTVTIVEFTGGLLDQPDRVIVKGTGGHTIDLALPRFIPDDVLGPWLLSHRRDCRVWSSVYRRLPVDVQA